MFFIAHSIDRFPGGNTAGPAPAGRPRRQRPARRRILLEPEKQGDQTSTDPLLQDTLQGLGTTLTPSAKAREHTMPLRGISPFFPFFSYFSSIDRYQSK